MLKRQVDGSLVASVHWQHVLYSKFVAFYRGVPIALRRKCDEERTRHQAFSNSSTLATSCMLKNDDGQKDVLFSSRKVVLAGSKQTNHMSHIPVFQRASCVLAPELNKCQPDALPTYTRMPAFLRLFLSREGTAVADHRPNPKKSARAKLAQCEGMLTNRSTFETQRGIAASLIISSRLGITCVTDCLAYDRLGRRNL